MKYMVNSDLDLKTWVTVGYLKTDRVAPERRCTLGPDTTSSDSEVADF